MILATVRWRHENVECVEPVLAGESGAIALFWHGRIPLCLAHRAAVVAQAHAERCVSPSADGELIARGAGQAGFPAIRGSSAKKRTDSAKATRRQWRRSARR